MYILEIYEEDDEKFLEYGMEKSKIYFRDDEDARTKIGIIKDSDNKVIFTFKYHYIGLKPQILFVPETEIIFVGFSNKVLGISLETNKIVIDFLGEIVFYEFILGNEVIVAIFEMSVLAMDKNGKLKWRFEAWEILTGWEIQEERLKLDFFDGN